MTLNKKYKPILMNLALAIPFSMVMSFIGMVISSGFFEGWIIAWLTNLLIMIPIAYLCGLIFVPMSQHIMSKINWK